MDYDKEYEECVRHLSSEEIALVEKKELSPEEEKRIRSSKNLSRARELYLRLARPE